jgi:hypothetical protein
MLTAGQKGIVAGCKVAYITPAGQYRESEVVRVWVDEYGCERVEVRYRGEPNRDVYYSASPASYKVERVS